MTAHKSGDPTTLNRLYGRQSGPRLRKAQQELVDTLLPAISETGEYSSAGLPPVGLGGIPTGCHLYACTLDEQLTVANKFSVSAERDRAVAL